MDYLLLPLFLSDQSNKCVGLIIRKGLCLLTLLFLGDTSLVVSIVVVELVRLI